MRTDKQIEASKTKGAKSQGPKTPEGKAESAQNANRHNLAGGHIVLAFQRKHSRVQSLLKCYYDAFAPANRSSGISSTN